MKSAGFILIATVISVTFSSSDSLLFSGFDCYGTILKSFIGNYSAAEMTDALNLDALYVRDEEILRRMGLAGGAAYKILRTLREDPRCPGRTIGGKTYWPAFRRFLDLINGLPVSSDVDEGPIPTRVLKQRPCPRLELTEIWVPNTDLPTPVSALDAERIRTRRGYTDTDGNFRISINGAGKVRVVAPDGRRWIEEAKPSDPAAWQRKRKFVARLIIPDA